MLVLIYYCIATSKISRYSLVRQSLSLSKKGKHTIWGSWRWLCKERFSCSFSLGCLLHLTTWHTSILFEHTLRMRSTSLSSFEAHYSTSVRSYLLFKKLFPNIWPRPTPHPHFSGPFMKWKWHVRLSQVCTSFHSGQSFILCQGWLNVCVHAYCWRYDMQQ